MLVVDLATPLLGAACGAIAAKPLHALAIANCLWWTIVAMAIAKRRGAHLRKWMRLGAFGFTAGYAYGWFSHGGPTTFTEHLWRYAGMGVLSALAAVPSGGLIHLWFEIRQRRRTD